MTLNNGSGHNGIIHSVVYNPVFNRAVTGSSDQTIKIWNFGTFKPGEKLDIPEVVHTLAGHGTSVMDLKCDFNSSRIFSVGNDKTIKVIAFGRASEIALTSRI